MKIYDCFMYMDEDLMVDVRLNHLNNFVNYFVIVEATFNHKGESRKLKFDLEKFKKFKNKIIYIVLDKQPNNIEEILKEDSEKQKNNKYIYNAVKRENLHRNSLSKGLEKADENDFILISDVDEIPKLDKINLSKINNKIVLFNQKIYCYKFNLQQDEHIWCGTKACRKKNLISPQWLRNVKDRNYPFWRIDTMFSNKKYSNMFIVNDGGWHFSNIKSPESILYKYQSYLHHREFDLNPITVDEIKKIIIEKKAIYDLKLDKRVGKKVSKKSNLKKIDIEKLPKYIQINKDKLKDWID